MNRIDKNPLIITLKCKHIKIRIVCEILQKVKILCSKEENNTICFPILFLCLLKEFKTFMSQGNTLCSVFYLEVTVVLKGMCILFEKHSVIIHGSKSCIYCFPPKEINLTFLCDTFQKTVTSFVLIYNTEVMYSLKNKYAQLLSSCQKRTTMKRECKYFSDIHIYESLIHCQVTCTFSSLTTKAHNCVKRH